MIEIFSIYIYIYLGICYKIKKSYPIFILYSTLFSVYMNLLEDLFFCSDLVTTLLQIDRGLCMFFIQHGNRRRKSAFVPL